MLNTDELDLSTLLKLHKHLGGLICEEMGHDWENVQFEEGSIHTGTVKRCDRCGDTQLAQTTSTTTGIQIDSSDLKIGGDS